MISILSEAGRAVLSGFVRSNTLLAFDYDGTLAPIVDDPEQAYMLPSTLKLLVAVARSRPAIILTGRARSDVLRFISGVPVLEVIGNHGAETSGLPLHRSAQKIAQWREELEGKLRGISGTSIEDKHHSLSIHYRACSDQVAAERQVREACGDLTGVRLIGGKAVLNLLPDDAEGKGEALLQALDRLDYPRALFVGDDETDEDVFRLKMPGRLLSIRVGARDHSQAEYLLESQTQINALLSLLASR